ncbi:hypothetical protein ACG04Q_02390 [Roseateles sp. DXS20W]|uniref:J domain-containing protein n=1 Tax=Pelomonas lactea TaxID=3299030 RepID=A0ABW7GEP6_9BURK
MWEEDWARLGIEPTNDLAAIKKAYALKLKTTRPDDDAEAYQALRGVYERAQQWARAQESTHTENAPPASAAVAPMADDVLHTTAAPPPASASETVRQLHACWEQQGAQALMAQWPALRSLLDAQPLAAGAEWSAHFAHWVAQQPHLPDAFVAALNDHFGWQEDFRVERQIGPQLAEAVQQALRERQAQPAPVSEELQQQVKPLRQLDRLRSRGSAGWWLALLLQPMLARLLSGLGPRILGQCGIDLDMRRSLDNQLQTAWLMRAGVLAVLVFGLFLLTSDEGDLATLRMTMWCLWGTGWLGASHVLGMFMHHGVMLQRTGGPALSLPLQRWRRHARQPAVGLGLIVVAGVLAAFSSEWNLTAWTLPLNAHTVGLLQTLLDATPWVVLWLGAMLAWPLQPIFSPICLGMLVPVASLLFHWASPSDPWAAVMAIAVLYVLVGAARFEDRLGGNVMLDAVCRPITNTLALAWRWGWPFALLPSLLTLAYLFSARPHPAVSSLTMVWVLSTLALHQLQHRAEGWALARLDRSA